MSVSCVVRRLFMYACTFIRTFGKKSFVISCTCESESPDIHLNVKVVRR